MTKLLGIDVGGTFTDFVLARDGEVQILKLPTSLPNQNQTFQAK